MELVYKNEKTLFGGMLVLSVLAWAAWLVVAGWSVAIYAMAFFLFYCFAQSALIAYIKGSGVRITDQQFPELALQIAACCTKLGLAKVPDTYLLQMGGVLNAFATRFFGRDFLVLYSEVVDGLHDNPDALNFYIGHEIGHIKRKHLSWSTVLLPASFLPLVGAAYMRAREYTCDRHGLAACDNPINAEFGIAALAAGPRGWRTMNKSAYIEQARQTDGFWMSFHELVADYPWLVKRMAAVRALAAGQEINAPRRHWLAKLLALFVPRLGVAGGMAGVLGLTVVIGVLAAIAIPAYQAYVQKAVVVNAYAVGRDASARVDAYYNEHGAVPTLAQAGIGVSSHPQGVREVRINPDNAVLHVITTINNTEGAGVLTLTPTLDDNKRIVWACSAEGIVQNALPADCRGGR